MKTSNGVKTLLLAFCAIFILVLTITVAEATTFTWNFSSPSGPVTPLPGTSHDYLDTTNAFTITASGFINAGPAPSAPVGTATWTLGNVQTNQLFGKNAGTGETGLGLAGQADFEIGPGTLIQLDLIDLINHGFTNKQVILGSVQNGPPIEGYAIFDSNSAAANGAQGTLVAAGTGGNIVSVGLPILTRYEWITATSGNILIDNGLTASTPVPEASTLLLFGLSLVSLAGIRIMFRK